MNNNVKKLLDTAYAELNYIEKASNADLDGKFDNPGSNNYTKYARDCFPELQGLAWCCMYIWWCFEKTFGKIMARNLVGEKTAKCSIMKERMLANGCQLVSNAKEGDLVFFDRGSGISHIGIVYSIGNTTFSTLEGNTTQSRTSKDYNVVVPNGGGVFIRAYSFGNAHIDSFVRPRWDLLKDNHETIEPVIAYNAEVKGNNVNIRDGAGTHCRWIGQVNKGYKINILSEKLDPNGRKWYRIIYKGAIAYICAEYIRKL